jgi:hypothetical protein
VKATAGLQHDGPHLRVKLVDFVPLGKTKELVSRFPGEGHVKAAGDQFHRAAVGRGDGENVRCVLRVEHLSGFKETSEAAGGSHGGWTARAAAPTNAGERSKGVQQANLVRAGVTRGSG